MVLALSVTLPDAAQPLWLVVRLGQGREPWHLLTTCRVWPRQRPCRSRALCLGASGRPQVAAYDTLMSPPLSSCGVEFGSAFGCGATGVYTIRMPKVSLGDLPDLSLS
jgi:hypothetical protein